jgi:hypothetical protein
MPAKTPNFPQRLAQLALSQARKRAGDGWTLLAPELRQALVSHYALAVLGTQEGEKYAAAVAVVEAVQRLEESLVDRDSNGA